jgi:hypothetical protein
MLRECAESISCIKLPLGTYFLQKFSKKIFFRDPAMIVTPPLRKLSFMSQNVSQNFLMIITFRAIFSFFYRLSSKVTFKKIVEALQLC